MTLWHINLVLTNEPDIWKLPTSQQTILEQKYIHKMEICDEM